MGSRTAETAQCHVARGPDERGTWQPRHTNSHYLQSVYCNGIYYIILGGGGRENKDVDRAPVYQPGAEKRSCALSLKMLTYWLCT